ncbi:AcrR family transcriptional regulator [Rubricella aquisinus]|uniref:AcrR family transcriptional regulator n=1 Tax=Rubricella aquisinus TaxID=2028108 RepID=A0A840WPU5_9RHOB|nr:TetR/AcrR family transcriptional regulator [Rubricella aquisinus]MBB5515672.1 AcrR family transcriptional regulator [Rubricella aquisinus]
MTDKEKRADEILDAAMAILVEEGWKGASMVAIARRANASKETLYAWFGNRQGLFEALIRRNAGQVDAALSAEGPLAEVMARFGTALLDLQLGEGALALNRVAIADVGRDPSLGRLLVETGRGKSLPLLAAHLGRAVEEGTVILDDPKQAVEDFLGLLKGDQQIVHLLGAGQRQDHEKRAAHATRQWFRLYGTAPIPG